MRKILWIGITNITVIGITVLVSYCLAVNFSFNVNFIRDLNEKVNGLTDSSFTSDILIMDEFNNSIRERQVHKPRLFDVRKNCNTEGCNSAENRSSEGERCKAEENKYTDIC
jgi:hypothetical protein